MTKVYFNELSARGSVNDADVKQTIAELLLCLQYLHRHNVDAVLVYGNIGQYQISSRRTIYQIIEDRNIIDDDNATFLMESFQEDFQLRDEIEYNNILDAQCCGLDAIGLTLASDYVNNGISLSLYNVGWDNNEYALQLKILDANGETAMQAAKAKNSSTTWGLDTYDSLFPTPPINIPDTGKILYIEIGTFFPNLIFSSDAKTFIKRCHSKEIITQIFLKLTDLNKVASVLSGRTFDKKMFSSFVSPESDTRDSMPELDVTFEDGVVRHCSWHLRYTPGAGRIHFSADYGDGNTIYVGYIGKKIKP